MGWFEGVGREYKKAKFAHDNEDDAATVRGEMDEAMTAVTNALDDSEEVKVKSDKGTLKEAEARAKELKDIEKREKAFLNAAKTDLSDAEGDRDDKEFTRVGADTALKTTLKEGNQEATM